MYIKPPNISIVGTGNILLNKLGWDIKNLFHLSSFYDDSTNGLPVLSSDISPFSCPIFPRLKQRNRTQ